MENMPPIERARMIVYGYAKDHLDKSDRHPTFALDEVYCVWFCYILGGWKALISTSLPDLRYYEVTHDKFKDATYLDVYTKVDNQAYPG